MYLIKMIINLKLHTYVKIQFQIFQMQINAYQNNNIHYDTT